MVSPNDGLITYVRAVYGALTVSRRTVGIDVFAPDPLPSDRVSALTWLKLTKS